MQKKPEFAEVDENAVPLAAAPVGKSDASTTVAAALAAGVAIVTAVPGMPGAVAVGLAGATNTMDVLEMTDTEETALNEIFDRYKNIFDMSNDNFYFTKDKFILLLPIDDYYQFAASYNDL